MGEWEDRLATGYRADNIPSSKLPESMPPVRPVQPTYPIETRYASDPHVAQYAPPDPAQYTPCMGRQVVAQEGGNRERRSRPRRACPRCGKQVAVDAVGRLWWHQRPGWGMWEDEGRCAGSGTR